MIPVSFEYARPQTIQEAVGFLEHEDAVVLAGGHSLLTKLKHRLLAPTRVVDINGLNLDEIKEEDGKLTIGATVRQAALMEATRGGAYDLLAKVGDAAGDPSIRARGTFVGALCALEPHGDWAAAGLALDAVLNVRSGSSERIIPLRDLASGDEQIGENALVVSATLKPMPQGAVCAYEKVKHAAIGWAIASVAFVHSANYARLAVSGACSVPSRLLRTELALANGSGNLMDEIDADLSAINFVGDSFASAEYRKRRLRILVQRLLNKHA